MVMNPVEQYYNPILEMTNAITHEIPSNDTYLGYFQRVYQMFDVYMDAGVVIDDSET